LNVATRRPQDGYRINGIGATRSGATTNMFGLFPYSSWRVCVGRHASGWDAPERTREIEIGTAVQ
jgi:hypothetical protein